MRYRFELLLGLLLALALLAGLLLYQTLMVKSEPVLSATPTELAHGLLFPEPRALNWPPFVLHNGEPLGSGQLEGNWTLVFFGYTSCPDICPTTLAVLKQLKNQLQAEGVEPPRVLLVSVDPRRDTLERLGQYLPWFDAEFLGARGDATALAQLAFQLDQPYLPVPDDARGNYTVAHSGALMLLDPEGRYAGYLYSADALEPLLHSLRPVLATGP